MGLPHLAMFGYYGVIIEWMNSLIRMRVLELEHWSSHILDLKYTFHTFVCQHISREQNMLEDGLSKEALDYNTGQLSITEFMEGKITYLFIFWPFKC